MIAWLARSRRAHRSSTPSRRVLGLVLLWACGAQTSEVRHLEPYVNPAVGTHPRWAPQPPRDRPREVVVDSDGRGWVTLQGSRDAPGHEVAAVDPRSGTVERLDLGGFGPTGLALHPDGRWLVVFLRFSDHAAVVDVERTSVVAHVPVGFYAQEGAFTPDGNELWVTSRLLDAVEVWEVLDRTDTLQLVRAGTIAVTASPRDVAVSVDGTLAAVGSPTSTGLSVLDIGRREERLRLDIGAPANGLAFAGGLLLVATTGAGSGHPAERGPLGPRGTDGDGTPNVLFSDLQNELLVVEPHTGEVLQRVTSDSTCCHEPLDVRPTDRDRSGELLPPREDWIVEGALPQQIVAARDAEGWSAWVGYSASNQVQRFELDPATGTLASRGTWPTSGHEPQGMALSEGALMVVHRLSETLGVYDASTGSELGLHVVGDLSGGPFPSTDAELGALVANVGGPFSADGDQSCAHCHPRGSAIDRRVALGLGRYPGEVLRQVVPLGGLSDTAPWFHEGVVDHGDFFPSNLSHVDPDLRETTRSLAGRTTTFGDATFDPSGTRAPVRAGFDGLAQALSAHLITDTHLLPSPYAPDTDLVRLGEAVFARADTGCSVCHPAPAFAVSQTHNPAGLPLRMDPVVSPARAPDGTNRDLMSERFVRTFPRAEQHLCADLCPPSTCAADPTACDDLRQVRLAAPSLRGLWDRARFLHDGRARSLREVLATPGHPALRPGERGFNERDGVPDTHGGTSHLTGAELDALVAYLRTL